MYRNNLLICAVSVFVSVNVLASESRYTCRTQCVVFKIGNGSPLIAGIHSLRAAKSNYSEESAIEKLEGRCSKIARTSHGRESNWMIAARVLAYGSKEAESESSALGTSMRFGWLGGLRGFSVEGSHSHSTEYESLVQLSESQATCKFNALVPQSAQPEKPVYTGNRIVGG